MKRQLPYFLRLLICAGLLLSLHISCFASHILGGELFYTHVSGNTYKITCVLYGDCSSAAGINYLSISGPQICIYDSDAYVSVVSTHIQAPDSGIEVTSLCSGDSSQCTNPASTIPGIKKFVYSATITLPHTSATWVFVYEGNNGAGAGGGRSAAITNLLSTGGTIIQLSDTLNNITAPNSNPVLSDSLRTTFCINQHADFKPNPSDPDGDSMYIFLTTPMNGTNDCGSTGVPCTYLGNAWPGMPISSTTPIQVLPDSFQFNHHTGQMSFFPNVFERPDINYNIREYRGGVLVGTSQHEFNFLVLECMGSLPCLINSCSGTPVAGTVNAAIDTGCIPFVSVLSLVGSTLATGLAYQWQSSPDSATWANIPGATNGTFSATISVSGYYRCSVTCLGSGGSDTSAGTHITADTSSIPTVTISAIPGTSINAGQYDTLTAIVAGAIAPTFQWFINGSAIPGATSATFIRHTFVNNDSVTCVVTNSITCGYFSFNSIILSVIGYTGIQQLISDDEITLIPNPNNGVFIIKGALGNDEKVFIEITNTIGQVIFKNDLKINNSGKNRQVQVDITGLPTGLYFVKINGSSVQKFVKE